MKMRPSILKIYHFCCLHQSLSEMASVFADIMFNAWWVYPWAVKLPVWVRNKPLARIATIMVTCRLDGLTYKWGWWKM